MKINLSEKQVEEIKDSLLARNVASFEYDGKMFFVRLDKVSFNEKDTAVNNAIKLKETFSEVVKEGSPYISIKLKERVTLKKQKNALNFRFLGIKFS